MSSVNVPITHDELASLDEVCKANQISREQFCLGVIRPALKDAAEKLHKAAEAQAQRAAAQEKKARTETTVDGSSAPRSKGESPIATPSWRPTPAEHADRRLR